MTVPDDPAGASRPKGMSKRAAIRQARLEEQLRTNLRRRKDQARARSEPPPPAGATPPPDRRDPEPTG